MRRREFITLIGGGTAAAWAFTVRAQEPERMRRIGALIAYAEGDSEAQAWLAAFREQFQKLGWTEGRNIKIDMRWATDVESRQRFAKELVALRPGVILAHTTSATVAAQQATRTIPIVFVQVADPIGGGLVTSLPRPGGNITGFMTMEPAMAGKWVELLKEIAPRVTRVAFLFNPTTAPYVRPYLDYFKTAARSFAVEPIPAPVHDRSDLESIVAAQAHEPSGGLMVMPDPSMTAHRAEIISLADRYRLPVIAPYRYYTELGGLLSYGNDIRDNYRRAATYVDRILKGEKPRDLPVQIPVKFELVINLKTAKALGLEVPFHLQQLADEVIE
jgi:putative ABC transport system substrate-binding protein